MGNHPKSWPPFSQLLVDRSSLWDCSISLSYIILQRVKGQYILSFSTASAWAIGYLLQLVKRLLSHWSVTVAHLQNQGENHISCKPKGYVITACSGLGYHRTDFSDNLPFEKYADVLCLLPLCQTISFSPQHTAGGAAWPVVLQSASNKQSRKGQRCCYSEGRVEKAGLSSSWFPNCFSCLHTTGLRSSHCPRRRGWREGWHCFHPA